MMNQSNIKNDKVEKINYYKNLADTIKKNITSRKRPLIVEFSGLPKAGKTTVVNSLALFLRRNGIPTTIITERASICPIKNKEHLDFNIWTGCTSLVNMLFHKQSNEHYVIIIDRGIFDTLVWLLLLNKRGKLNDSDLKVLEEFFLLDKWRSKIDLVICMRANIQKALEREFKDLLTDIPGSIMNETFLGEFLTILDKTQEKFKNSFKKIINIDTSNTQTLEGVEIVTSEVIKNLEYLSNEELITIPLHIFRDKLNFVGFEGERGKFQILERLISKNKYVVRRKEAEEKSELLQLIVCSIITYKNKIAIFTKKEIGDKRLHNKKMIWVGGHLQNYDFEEDSQSTILESMKNCLKRELEEELEIDYDAKIVPTFKGIVYDNTNRKSLQHLGIVFQIDLKDLSMVNSLDKKIFKELSGQGIEVEFVELSEDYFIENKIELEPWSADILYSLFNIKTKINKDSSQMVFF